MGKLHYVTALTALLLYIGKQLGHLAIKGVSWVLTFHNLSHCRCLWIGDYIAASAA